MRVRLTGFAGLRVEPAPGWHELPSHVPSVEVRRLLDLLANAVEGVEDVVECAWADLESIAAGLGSGTLAHVRVPSGVAAQQLDATLSAVNVRLGLVTVDEPGRWPERAWDELEVKSALATWLRRSLRRSSHPLAGLGVAKLPIDLLIGATGEPVELLELVEAAMEFGARQFEPDGAVDWQQCARWSIAQRLAARLGRGLPQLRPQIARLICDTPNGAVPALVDAATLDELARLGLVHRAEGDAVLVPLARVAAAQGVVELLEVEGVHAEFRPARGRQRAMTVGDAVACFDPVVELAPNDPWFVDLRPQLPALNEFASALKDALGSTRGYARVSVAAQPGSGADTMIRTLLRELASVGVVPVSVAGAPDGKISSGVATLAALRSLLEWCDLQAEVELPEELLAGLRQSLAEIALEDELREYVMLTTGRGARVQTSSVLVLLRRLLDASPNAAVSKAVSARVHELSVQLGAILRTIGATLAGHGWRLCLHFPLSSHFDARTFESFAELECSLVVGPGSTSRSMHRLSFPDKLLYGEAGQHCADAATIVGQLLAARADLDAIFDDVDARLHDIAKASGGHLRAVFALAHQACVLAGDAKVGRAEIERARATLQTDAPG